LFRGSLCFFFTIPLEYTPECSSKEAYQQLIASDLAQSAWQIEQWHPHMVETAIQIAQKWKAGWE